MLYQRVSNKLKNSDFFRNAAVLSSGTAVAQGISIFTAPALTRIYHPVDYGLLGVYMTFCALLSTLSTFQYSNAIVIAKEDDQAQDVLKLSWLINGSICILVAILLLALRSAVGKLYNIPQMASWVLLAPVSIFFVGLNSIFSAWAIRKKEFKLLSRNRIYTALLAPFFSISLGFFIAGPTGLFVGLLISQVLPTIRMSYFFYRKDSLDFHFNKHKLKKVMHDFRNFPRYSLPADFINNFSNQIPVLMLSQLAGPQVVGWYNLSVRMLGLPSSLVSTSVGDIFRQRAAQDYNNYGTCRPVFLKVLKSLSLISIVPLGILLIFGPDLFAFVFGEKWREAGTIAQILAVLYAFKFVVSPLSYTTYIANKQWVGLVIDILLLAILISIFYVSRAYHFPYTTSLLIFALGYCALYFLTFFLSYKFTINERFNTKN